VEPKLPIKIEQVELVVYNLVFRLRNVLGFWDILVTLQGLITAQ
jgi:hypothetical protein